MTPQHRAVEVELARLKGALRLMRKRAVMAESALAFAEQRATEAWAREEHDRLERYSSRNEVSQPALQLAADEPAARQVARARHEGMA
jgi:hypothetical protein